MSERTDKLRQYQIDQALKTNNKEGAKYIQLRAKLDALEPAIKEMIECRKIEGSGLFTGCTIGDLNGAVYITEDKDSRGVDRSFYYMEGTAPTPGYHICRKNSEWGTYDVHGDFIRTANSAELTSVYESLSSGLKMYFAQLDKKIGYTPNAPKQPRRMPPDFPLPDNDNDDKEPQYGP